jgi:hypothetical protein
LKTALFDLQRFDFFKITEDVILAFLGALCVLWVSIHPKIWVQRRPVGKAVLLMARRDYKRQISKALAALPLRDLIQMRTLLCRLN